MLLLSVVSSTLALTHARCSGMDHGRAPAGTMAGMDHGTGHDDRMPEGGQCERGPGMPSEHGAGMSCLFAAHCVAPMIAVERSAALSEPAASTSNVASPQTAPAVRALEPESPPPRA